MVLPGCELWMTPRPPPRPVPGEFRIGWFKKFTKSRPERQPVSFSEAELLLEGRCRDPQDRGRALSLRRTCRIGSGSDGAYDAGIEPLDSRRRNSPACRTRWAGAMQLAREPRELVPEVSPARNGQRESAVPAEDRARLPAADERSAALFMSLSVLLAFAHRHFVHGVGGEDVSDIVVARTPLRLHVVQVLAVRRCGCGLAAPGAVVTAGVGHALRVGVGHLVLQAVAVCAAAEPPAARCSSGCRSIPCRKSGRCSPAPDCRRGTGSGRWCRPEFSIRWKYGIGTIRCVASLPDVADLECGVVVELMLQREVPLVHRRPA